jgi:preprotein translocase subunit SecY
LIIGDVIVTSIPEAMMSTPEAMTSTPETMTSTPETMTPIPETSNRSDPIVAIGAGVGGALVVFIILVIIVVVLVLVVSSKRKAEKSDQVHQGTCTLRNLIREYNYEEYCAQ